MPRLTVSIDPALCIGAASCVASAPELFQLDEDNIAYFNTAATGPARSLTLDATDEQKRDIDEAAANCPTGAIGVR